MSYCIRYGKENPQEHRWKMSRNRLSVGVLAAAVFFAVAMIPQVQHLLRMLFAPWWDDTTAGAFSNLIGAVAEGEAVPSAFLDFCRDILSNGQILS